jgi:hypothetical protein
MLADVEITDESPDLVAWMERLPLQSMIQQRRYSIRRC